MCLEFLEPAIVGTVRGSYGVTRLIVTQVIDVATGTKAGFHFGICLSRPGNRGLGQIRVHPFAQHKEIVALGTVRERRVGRPNPGCRAMEVLQE